MTGRAHTRSRAVGSLRGNSATRWLFAERGLGGTPWEALSRTGLGTRVGSTGLVEYGPHSLASESEFRNGLADAPIRGGLLTATSMPGFAGAIAFGHDGVTSSYAYKNIPLVGNAGYRVSVVVEMADSLAPVFGSSVHSSSTNDFVLIFNGGTLNPTLNSVTNLGGGRFKVSGVATAPASPGTYCGVVKYNTNSARTFKVTAYCVELTPSSGEYVPTTASVRYLPRITHDPVTVQRLGLLVEGQATNLLGQTRDFSGGLWLAASASVASNTTIGPDGSALADTITLGAGGYVYQGVTASYSAGATVTWSVDVKSSTRAIQFGGATPAGTDAYTIQALGSGWHRQVLTRTFSGAGTNATIQATFFSGQPIGTTPFAVDNAQLEFGASASSRIINSGTGSAVRVADSAGPGLALTGSALPSAFPGGVTQPFTGVIKYRKAYSVASNETLCALSAGSTAGGTNLLAVRTNGTQAQLVHGGGAGALTGALVHDGNTVNRVAYSVDPVAGKMSISVNGASAVETTGIAYTGAGVAALIAGSQTYSGTEPMGSMVIDSWDHTRSTYITGAALAALSA